MVIDFRCEHHGHMLELLGERRMDVTLIDRLNELLEAERAGVDTLSRLYPEARGPEMQKLFEEVRNDEEGASEKKGDFAEK
jgi:rubrerythrin